VGHKARNAPRPAQARGRVSDHERGLDHQAAPRTRRTAEGFSQHPSTDLVRTLCGDYAARVCRLERRLVSSFIEEGHPPDPRLSQALLLPTSVIVHQPLTVELERSQSPAAQGYWDESPPGRSGVVDCPQFTTLSSTLLVT
jgi:hypothetical protein